MHYYYKSHKRKKYYGFCAQISYLHFFPISIYDAEYLFPFTTVKLQKRQLKSACVQASTLLMILLCMLRKVTSSKCRMSHMYLAFLLSWRLKSKWLRLPEHFYHNSLMHSLLCLHGVGTRYGNMCIFPLFSITKYWPQLGSSLPSTGSCADEDTYLIPSHSANSSHMPQPSQLCRHCSKRSSSADSPCPGLVPQWLDSRCRQTRKLCLGENTTTTTTTASQSGSGINKICLLFLTLQLSPEIPSE